MLVVFGITCGITALAQETTRTRKTFYAPIEVPLVNVDVYVSDRDGRPIPGLGRDDFRVFEDGRPVEISHFYTAPQVLPFAADLPAQSEAVAEEEPEMLAEEEPKQDLFMVIFIDDTNLSRGRRQSAITYIEEFVSMGAAAGLHMMLISYDGRLQIVQPFTQNRDLISAGIETIAGMGSLAYQIEEERLIRDMEAAMAVAVTYSNLDTREEFLDTYGRSLLQEIQSFAQQQAQRARTGCQNLTKLIRSLSGLEGRKALLWVSDGIEPRPGERLYSEWAQIFGSTSFFETEASMAFNRALQENLSPTYTELARFANSHRVTIYSLSSMGDAQFRNVSASNRLVDISLNSVQQSMSEEVLAGSLAADTGGRSLQNSPALANQLLEVSEELSSYYSLAYRPEHVGDGSYHRIEVEVASAGARVRHRNGYYDIPPEEQLNNRVLAAAIHGVGENEMGIAVKTFEPTRREDGAYLLPLIVAVPVSELILTPAADEHQGRISVILAVRDEHGGLSDVQRREYPIAVPNELLAESIGKTAGFTTRLAVRGGKQRIAVGVIDEISRSESVTSIDLEVPGTDG
jgi:VWFA-related protein